MIKAVLFDIDGTLVNSLGNYLQAYKKILEYYGFHFLDEAVINLCFGRTEEAICTDLRIPEKAEEFRKKYFESVKKTIPKLQLFPDTVNTFKYLQSRQIPIGIITFAHNWYLEALIKRFDLDTYAQVMIGFNDVQKAKPDPEAVLKASKVLGVKPSSMLIVGDSRSDMLMGNNAGSKTALYTPQENARFYDFEELIQTSKPDFVIKQLSEIKDLLS